MTDARWRFLDYSQYPVAFLHIVGESPHYIKFASNDENSKIVSDRFVEERIFLIFVKNFECEFVVT